MTPEHKCLITGIGRSGTTFLVQLLTELGLDTGFSDPRVMQKHLFSTTHAGLEFPRFAQDGAYAFAKLKALAPTMPQEEFLGRFRKVSRPDLVHSFDAATIAKRLRRPPLPLCAFRTLLNITKAAFYGLYRAPQRLMRRRARRT